MNAFDRGMYRVRTILSKEGQMGNAYSICSEAWVCWGVGIKGSQGAALGCSAE